MHLDFATVLVILGVVGVATRSWFQSKNEATYAAQVESERQRDRSHREKIDHATLDLRREEFGHRTDLDQMTHSLRLEELDLKTKASHHTDRVWRESAALARLSASGNHALQLRKIMQADILIKNAGLTPPAYRAPDEFFSPAIPTEGPIPFEEVAVPGVVARELEGVELSCTVEGGLLTVNYIPEMKLATLQITDNLGRSRFLDPVSMEAGMEAMDVLEAAIPAAEKALLATGTGYRR